MTWKCFTCWRRNLCWQEILDLFTTFFIKIIATKTYRQFRHTLGVQVAALAHVDRFESSDCKHDTWADCLLTQIHEQGWWFLLKKYFLILLENCIRPLFHRKKISFPWRNFFNNYHYTFHNNGGWNHVNLFFLVTIDMEKHTSYFSSFFKPSYTIFDRSFYAKRLRFAVTFETRVTWQLRPEHDAILLLSTQIHSKSFFESKRNLFCLWWCWWWLWSLSRHQFYSQFSS